MKPTNHQFQYNRSYMSGLVCGWALMILAFLIKAEYTVAFWIVFVVALLLLICTYCLDLVLRKNDM